MSSFESWLKPFDIDALGLWVCMWGGRQCTVQETKGSLFMWMYAFIKYKDLQSCQDWVI